MKKINLIVLLIIIIGTISAQDSTEVKTTKAQLTFFYPLGTNGVKSFDYTNKFSVNVLFGLNGGVDGAELGYLANLNNGNVKGFQAAGLFNAAKGNVNGAQFSGLFNSNLGDVKGFRGSGLFNFNVGNVQGVQAAGLFNFNTKNVKGGQFSGLYNANIGETDGISAAGLINFNTGYMKGASISGIANITADSVKGIQIGLFNFARKLKGVQIGLVNVCDSSENCLPIGLISIVRGGLYELEVTGGDVIYSNFNFKIGVDRFYTIFKTGFTVFEGEPFYSFGIGCGTNIKLKENKILSIDISSSHILNDDDFDDFDENFSQFDEDDFDFDDYEHNHVDVNQLNKIDLTYKQTIKGKFSFMIGPSFNLYLTQKEIDGEYGTLNVPYTIFEKEYESGKISSWIGINAGVSFRF